MFASLFPMIKIGLLGAAKIAPPAIIQPAGLRDDCAIISVAARDASRAETFALTNGIPEVEKSYEALIARSDIDLIYNALPPNRHADLSIAALKAGKIVLCEKPFAMNATEATRMVQVARETGGILIEAFHYRYHPAFVRAVEVVRSGELGEIVEVTAKFSVEIPYKEGELRHTLGIGGGSLMDLGCYPLHWARTLLGQEPAIVSAAAVCEQDNVDLSIQAVLAFPGGARGDISCSMAPGVETSAYFELKGAKGALMMINPLAPHMGHQIKLTRNGETTTETVDAKTTYDHQLAHVIDVIQNDATPLTGGVDAVANMTAIDAIYTAAGLRPRGMD